MPPPAKQHPAIRLLSNHPERFTRQGSVVAAWRNYGDRRLGPYYRLVWREDGRQRTLYLGRQSPLVDDVRHLLATIQARTRFQREVRKRRARFRREVLRPLKRYLDQTFLVYGGGLYLKGYELRGHYARAGKLPPLRLPACGFSDSSSRLDPPLRAEGSRHRPIPPPLPGTVPAGPPPQFPFPPIAPIAEHLPLSPEQAPENQQETPNPSGHSDQQVSSDTEEPSPKTDASKENSATPSPRTQVPRGNSASERIATVNRLCAKDSSLQSPVSSLNSCLEFCPFVTQNLPTPCHATWVRPRGPP